MTVQKEKITRHVPYKYDYPYINMEYDPNTYDEEEDKRLCKSNVELMEISKQIRHTEVASPWRSPTDKPYHISRNMIRLIYGYRCRPANQMERISGDTRTIVLLTGMI